MRSDEVARLLSLNNVQKPELTTRLGCDRIITKLRMNDCERE